MPPPKEQLAPGTRGGDQRVATATSRRSCTRGEGCGPPGASRDPMLRREHGCAICVQSISSRPSKRAVASDGAGLASPPETITYCGHVIYCLDCPGYPGHHRTIWTVDRGGHIGEIWSCSMGSRIRSVGHGGLGHHISHCGPKTIGCMIFLCDCLKGGWLSHLRALDGQFGPMVVRQS